MFYKLLRNKMLIYLCWPQNNKTSYTCTINEQKKAIPELNQFNLRKGILFDLSKAVYLLTRVIGQAFLHVVVCC